MQRVAGIKPDPADGSRPLPFTRELLGQLAYEAFIRALIKRGDEVRLMGFDELHRSEREMYCNFGEDVARWTLIGDALVFAGAAMSEAIT